MHRRGPLEPDPLQDCPGLCGNAQVDACEVDHCSTECGEVELGCPKGLSLQLELWEVVRVALRKCAGPRPRAQCAPSERG